MKKSVAPGAVNVSHRAILSTARHACIFATLLIAALCMIQPISTAQTADDTETKLEISPYGWAPSLTGTISLQGLSVPLDLGTDELARDVEAGGMGVVRLTRGDYFLISEGLWIKYKDTQSNLFFNQRVDSELKFAALGAGRNWHVPIGETELTIAPFAGLQYVELRSKVTSLAAAIEANNEWVDPIAGVILELKPNSRFGLGAKLDVTGFGASDVNQVSLHGVANYALNDSIAISAGYRWADADYSGANEFQMELTGHGPLIGLVAAFGN